MFYFSNKNKGVAVYLALVFLALLLGISFGLSAIILGQFKTLKDIGFSTVAFYAADTGIEKYLFENSPSGDYSCFIDIDSVSIDCYSSSRLCPDNLNISLGREACAKIKVDQSSGKVTSSGYYRTTNRAIEISF